MQAYGTVYYIFFLVITLISMLANKINIYFYICIYVFCKLFTLAGHDKMIVINFIWKFKPNFLSNILLKYLLHKFLYWFANILCKHVNTLFADIWNMFAEWRKKSSCYILANINISNRVFPLILHINICNKTVLWGCNYHVNLLFVIWHMFFEHFNNSIRRQSW